MPGAVVLPFQQPHPPVHASWQRAAVQWSDEGAGWNGNANLQWSFLAQ